MGLGWQWLGLLQTRGKDHVLYLCSVWVSKLITPLVSASFYLLLFLPCASHSGALYCTSDLSPVKDLSSGLTSIKMQSMQPNKSLHAKETPWEHLDCREGGRESETWTPGWQNPSSCSQAVQVHRNLSLHPWMPNRLGNAKANTELNLQHQLSEADCSFWRTGRNCSESPIGNQGRSNFSAV